MGLLIRTLLIWLLVLAVPAQGAAAATMAFCGPNHSRGAVSVQVQPAVPAAHAHQPSNAAATPDHHSVAAVADEDPSASERSTTAAKVSHASKHKCSACAACCSGSAIMNSVLVVPAPVFTPTVFSAVMPSVDTFAADGPDRPPRFVLA